MGQNRPVTLSDFSWLHPLYAVVTLSLVFKLQYPVLQNISRFASINSEDIVILVLTVVLVAQYVRNREFSFRLLVPRLTAFVTLLLGWILLTVGVAFVRSDQSVLASILWTMKSLEVLVFLFIIQQHVDRSIGRTIIHTFLVAGSILATWAIVLTLQGISRVEIFFSNPNGLSTFLMFVVFVSAAKALSTDSLRTMGAYGAVGLLSITGIISTVSRAAVAGLLAGMIVLLVLIRRQVSDKGKSAIGIGIVGLFVTVPQVIGRSGLRRFTNWFTYQNGTFALADTSAAHSFRTRLALIEYGMQLFAEQPVFGYGWYASPSRITFLDVYYATILVEVGIIGTLLFGLFHFLVLRHFWSAWSHGLRVLGAGTFAWHVGMLGQAVGGPFPRVPHHMFITFLVLVAVIGIQTDQKSNTQSTPHLRDTANGGNGRH